MQEKYFEGIVVLKQSITMYVTYMHYRETWFCDLTQVAEKPIAVNEAIKIILWSIMLRLVGIPSVAYHFMCMISCMSPVG